MELGSHTRSEAGHISKTSISNREAGVARISMKPVSIRGASEPHLDRHSSNYSQDASSSLAEDFKSLDVDNATPPLPPRSYLSTDEVALSVDTALSSLENYQTTNTASPFSANTSTPDTIRSPGSSLSNASSYTKKAYQDVRHFAGGLIHHPAQSNKHFSILRHSHGLVFYQGPATSIAMSIFADAPLPADRTIWLQTKGWTGKAGMRARALTGWNGKWLNVTPKTRADPDQLRASDEQAWQRDITRFLKRADHHVRANHKLRETVIVRIPVEASDGYYRLVLCTGAKKKVLCPSPVFRVLSTSTRPSSIRGAGLSTLPLEVGARILTSTAKTSIQTSIGGAIAPITAAVQQQIQPYEPSWTTRTAGRVAYDLSGISKKVDTTIQDADSLYDQKRDQTWCKSAYEELSDYGPDAPFPIAFTASVDKRSTITEEFDIPVTYLTSVPGDVLSLLNGYYFGWVQNGGKQDNQSPTLPQYNDQWHKAIISAISFDELGSSDIKIARNDKKDVAIYLVQEDDDPITLGLEVQIQVMGFIRPSEQAEGQRSTEGLDTDDIQAETAVLRAINDIEITQAFLDQPAWAPRFASQGTEMEKPTPIDRMKSSYVGTRMSLERQLKKVPLHKAGIRLPIDRFREVGVDIGGIYVPR